MSQGWNVEILTEFTDCWSENWMERQLVGGFPACLPALQISDLPAPMVI